MSSSVSMMKGEPFSFVLEEIKGEKRENTMVWLTLSVALNDNCQVKDL